MSDLHGEPARARAFHDVDPGAFVYTPDLDNPALNVTEVWEQSLNLTWQATGKDKVKLYWTNSATNQPWWGTGRQLACCYLAPSSGVDVKVRTNTYQATWTRPQTNLLLFEAGASHLPVQHLLRPTASAVTTIPGILEFAPVTGHRNMSGWFTGSIRLPDRVTTSANDFGGESRTWQGFDFTLDARLRDVLFQGGVSTGAYSTDRCAQLAALPENVATNESPTFCSTDEAWLTQIKFLTSY